VARRAGVTKVDVPEFSKVYTLWLIMSGKKIKRYSAKS